MSVTTSASLYNEPLARAIMDALRGMRRRRARFHKKTGRFVMYVDVPGKLKLLKVVVEVKPISYVVNVVPTNRVYRLDTERRGRVAAKCAEINRGLRHGAFGIEQGNDVVCYRSIVSAVGVATSKPRVAYSVASAIETTLRHSAELYRAT